MTGAAAVSLPSPHLPVMCNEVIAALAPGAGDVMVDGTFGAGGYSEALLRAAPCAVHAIDRDPSVAPQAERLSAAYGARFHWLQGCFGDMETLLRARGVTAVDGVTLDLGVSSMQLDQPERGFSFQSDGPLDMRMAGAAGGESAADIVNSRSEEEIADIIFHFGEERRARAVARAIAQARKEAPITRTGQLAAIVSRVVRGTPGHHPATRSFQALRIYVNDELGELQRGLAAAERLLKPEGRLAVVSFHSLEDRVVKRFLDRRCGKQAGGSRHLPQAAAPRAASFAPLHKGALAASASESAANPRARSAKLRAARRTLAPAWPMDDLMLREGA